MTAIERDNPALKDVLPKDHARPALDKTRLGQVGVWRKDQLLYLQCRGQPLRRVHAHGAGYSEQQRNIHDYLRTAYHAAVRQQPPPSLLPPPHSVIR